MARSSESLGKATTRGALWLTLQSVSARLFSLLSQLVLAWLLVPADFGLIGLAYTITTVIGAVVSFGVDDVLLQRQRTIRLWQSSAFWASLGLSVLGALAMVAAAPLAAALYHSPKLVGLIAVLALSMPIGAVSTVSAVTVRARMGFRFLALYSTFEIAATALLTILFAWQKLGAYSFAIPLPIVLSVKAVLFWSKAPPRLRGRIRLSQLQYLARSGFKVFGTRLLIQSVSQGDYFTLGVMASHAVVGSYYFAFRLASQPLRMLAGNFSNVLFPAFAQLNFQPERQLAAAINASRLLAFIVMPFCFLQAAMSGPLLRFAFGAKWLSAIPLVQALSIGLPFDAISWVGGAFMTARGEFRRQLVLTAALTPLFFAFVVSGALIHSALGVAWGVTAYYVVTGPIYAIVAFGRAGASLKSLLGFYVVPPLIAGLAIGAAFLAVQVGGPGREHDLIRLIVLSLLGPALYVAAVRLLAPAILTQITERIGLRKLQGRFRIGERQGA